MSTYSLTVQIDATDLPVLQGAGEQIVLVRRLADAGSPVAWITIPLAQNNVVTWDDQYVLFGASVAAAVGQVVIMNNTTDAVLQNRYSYTASGFSAPTPDGSLPSATVQIQNGDGGANAFGLAQSCSLSRQASPLNSQSVPAKQFVRFTASQSLWVYLASGISSGMVVAPPVTSPTRQVYSGALLVDFDTGSASRTVRYSATLGQFVTVG
jgi:hypothetical protein